MFEAYLIALTGVALAQAAPGPNFLAVVSAGLGQGRRAAMYTVFGVATGMMVWALAVAFGLAAVLAIYPSLLTIMKILGGGYLMWMAFKAIQAGIRKNDTSIKPYRQTLTPFAAWRRGLLVIITNPKAALMWVAVGTFLFGSGLHGWVVAGFGPFAALSAVVIYGGYAYLFTTGLAIKSYNRFARWFEFAFGAAFGAFGGKLLIDGVEELRS